MFPEGGNQHVKNIFKLLLIFIEIITRFNHLFFNIKWFHIDINKSDDFIIYLDVGKYTATIFCVSFYNIASKDWESRLYFDNRKTALKIFKALQIFSTFVFLSENYIRLLLIQKTVNILITEFPRFSVEGNDFKIRNFFLCRCIIDPAS